MSTLSFEWKSHESEGKKPPPEHRVFVIDGVTLEDHLLRRAREAFDFVSPFGWLDPSFEREACDQLLGTARSELESGRVPLLVCPIRADLGCGCVSVFIELEADSVTWHGFAYENNYEPDDTMLLEGMPRFTFPRAAYEAAVAQLAPRPGADWR